MANRNYIMRAESFVDIGLFMSAAALRLTSLSVAHIDIGNYIVKFSGISEIDKFREVLKGVGGGGLMLRTLNYTRQYTGKEYYNEEPINEAYHDATQQGANVRSILSAREEGESSGSGAFSEDNTDS